MNKKKNTLWVVFLSFTFGIAGAWTFGLLSKDNKVSERAYYANENMESDFIQKTGLSDVKLGDASFIKASKESTPAVVYIKTISKAQVQANPFDWFFDPYNSRSQVTTGTGSGVIISDDGYIVTNYHVIKGANSITVILNQKKREFEAKLIGTDPSTDLALLKIEATGLPSLSFGNSDELQVGEWVLAVGNPFNLTSTVTAGIVSAKGRNINIVNNQFPIESFIQTDAAINPGNSGGALVDLNGKLIGINTAIASQTGSYNGYGFAIPSNIANKIVNDFIKYGSVQRGFTGITAMDIDFSLQKEKGIKLDNGVYVAQILEESPAEKEGIKIGDIVTAIDGRIIDSKAMYDEIVSYYRPGDKLKVKLMRNGVEKEVSVTLISEENTVKLMRKNTVNSPELGADFTPISKSEQDIFEVAKGIKITNIKRGYMAQLGISDGFIITQFNGKAYDDAADLISAIKTQRGRIEIEGIGSNGGKRKMSFYGY